MFTTDKVSQGYLPTYLRIASELGTAARVCEVGVWRGESLTLWQSLFPDGLVVGVDNHEQEIAHWPSGTISVIASQDDPELPATLRDHSPEYDLIVDDASHVGQLTYTTFQNLWPLVAPGGYYVIEDWHISFLPHWNASMRVAVSSLLDLLGDRDGECESVEYRWGLAIARKKRVGR